MAKDQAFGISPLRRGRYVARLATGNDIVRAKMLRHHCFFEQPGLTARPGGLDHDPFDVLCDHVIVEAEDGQMVCAYRVLHVPDGIAMANCYAGQFYNLNLFRRSVAPMLELGRFCVRPDIRDPDVLRIAWGMLARLVDQGGISMLFGCASFPGIDPSRHTKGFDLLAARHLAPPDRRPGKGPVDVHPFADLARPVEDMRAAQAVIPPLLKTYLAMGGWVSDHAVIDPEMNTLHVFTGVEIAAVPPHRARALRAAAG